MTDILKAIAETQGMSISQSYRDLVFREPSDDREGDEIAADIILRAGLRFKEEGHVNTDGVDG